MVEQNNIELLDHGYARLIESWGSDERIIEAARMSTDKGFNGWGPVMCPVCTGPIDNPVFDDRVVPKDCTRCKGTMKVPGDERLLAYLYRNKHSTPFEMAGLTIEVKAPIFVFRQWHRHRTQSYNEMSARYTPLPNENYIPTISRLMVNSTKNKQAGTAKEAETLTKQHAIDFQHTLIRHYEEAQNAYEFALRSGVPKELARIHLPVARYSRMRASANLRNWLAFLTLRMHSHAQMEIRVYAEAVGRFIQESFPRTWELFVEGMSE